MNKKFRQFKWFAATLMLVAAMVMPSVAWADGSITPSKPKTGDGSAGSPYQISNKEELYWFAGLVNGDKSVCNDVVNQNTAACAKLMNDIVVNSYYGFSKHKWESVSFSDWFFWTPIGKHEFNKYTGTFDGQGHTISGLYFESCSNFYDQNSKDYDCQNRDNLSFGLFGFNSGTIKNVGVINSYFGWKYKRTGGICGENSGTIENCYNEGKVEGKGDDTGGICARNFGTITNCYNLGTVIGEHGTGVVCGCTYDNGTITNCYYLSDTATGGINGADATGSAEGKSADKFKSGEVAYLLNKGDTDGTQTWYQNLSAEGGDIHPVLTKTNSNTVYQVKLLCGGGTVYAGMTYANTNETVVKPHELIGENILNEVNHFYTNTCQTENKTVYFIDAAGTIEAIPNDDATVFTVASLTLEDATKYDNQCVFTVTDFTFNRMFTSTNWTTWYVPFELELTQAILDKYDFSRINNVHQYDRNDDGDVDETIVESFRMKSGATLKANYPYLVKPKNDTYLNMTIDLEDIVPAKAIENSIDCQSVDYIYTFKGTYSGKDDSGSGIYDPYTLYDGQWYHYHSLEPMRHDLTVTSRDTNTASAASLRSIKLSIIGEEDATGVVTIYSDEHKAKETYDLGGRRLPEGSQHRGLIIENGKVVYKK